MKLKQKCAVITGGANGIGRAVAELFVAEGARIAILDCDRRNGEAAVAALNGRALFLPCDVSDSRQADEALQTAVSHLGTIDILINDAASQLNKPLLETSDEEFRKVLDINLTATFHFTREAAKLMIAHRHPGVIVNFSSTFAFVGSPGYIAYHASKGGVAAFTRAAASP